MLNLKKSNYSLRNAASLGKQWAIKPSLTHVLSQPWLWLAAGLCILVDQGTKRAAFLLGHPIQLNLGFSFGLLSSIAEEIPAGHSLVALLSLAAAVLLIWLFAKEINQRPWLGGLLLGCTLANAIDRLLYGGVRDWLWVPGLNVYNNLADWGIGIGLLLLIILQIRDNR